MPSTCAPTVNSRVTSASRRALMPILTFFSGSVMELSREGVRLRIARLPPRQTLDRRSPGTPNVDAAEQEQPHDVDKVPIPGRKLEADVMAGRELPQERPDQANGQEDHADDNVCAVEAGRHEKGRAVDGILERERRVDVLVSLREHEQHAKRDGKREKILETPPVPLAQIVMGDVHREA